MKTRLFTLLIALLAIVTGAKAQKIDPFASNTLELELYSGEVLPEAGLKVLAFYANKANLKVVLDGQRGSIFYNGKTELFSIKVRNTEGIVTVPTGVTWKHNPGPVSVTQAELRELGITGYGKISVVFSVTINNTNFTDETFRTYVEKFDTNPNNKGRLTEAEAEAVTEIAVSMKGITSLKGIEYFTALTGLWCSNNQLTSLDVSKNTKLTELWCTKNQLTSLDVSGCTALTKLHCSDNQLTSLDVSGCTALTSLDCWSNQLTSLDVSKNTALTELYCLENQLTSLDVSKNTALTELHCSDNQLTSLDVSNNTALTMLYCYKNQLTSLDVSKNTALTELHCYDNQLTSLDVSGCTALKFLNCSSNNLTSLDVSSCTALENLWCSINQLTSLDVSKNTALSMLLCNNNRIRGAAMTALVESLPGDRTDAVMLVYEESDGNLMTPKQVAVATGKGWEVKKKVGDVIWDMVDYAGVRVPADANADGEVTAADAEAIVDYILCRQAPDSWFDEESADVVDDDVVDIQDLTQLIKLLTEE